jgi:hypothetical protein
MLPANPFIELLARYREAYGVHGENHLWFAAVTHAPSLSFFGPAGSPSSEKHSV